MSPALMRYAITIVLISLVVYGGCRRKPAPTVLLDDTAEPAASTERSAASKPSEPRFPRRLLFVSIGKYPFMNPLATASAERNRQNALTLASELKVPHEGANPQVFIASDSAEGNVLSKDTVIGTYDRFFDTSRPTDRIVVYFGGHALEIAGKAYLAPIEGSPDDPKSLIPLADFYAKLHACKAAQKVVIWDVCRYNPDRRRDGRGSEPMTSPLYKALTAAPAGVEVVTTCKPGENALEFTNLQVDLAPTAPRYTGSSFLESVNAVAARKRIELTPQTPADPIPVRDWVAAVASRVEEAAGNPKVKLTQTVSYHTKRQESTGEPNPPPEPNPPASKTARAEVAAIEEEFRVPPFAASQPVVAFTTYPFRDSVIAAYASDVTPDAIRKNKQKYPFEAATLSAFQVLREVWVFKAKGGLQRRESIAAPISDGLKRELKKELEPWAIGIEKLQEVDRVLESLADARKGQPKRWQAHYDYARAVVKARLAFMNEYDKLIGDVLTEVLPPLEKPMNGYRLTPSEKMKSRKDVQKIAADAAEAYDAIVSAHPDTPWSIQAKLEKSLPLGLVWTPIQRGK